MTNAKGIHWKSQQGEGLSATTGNHLSVLEDTALVALLKGCAKQKDLLKGSRIHACVLKSGLLEKNIYIGSTLINMYAKCGALPKAQQVFDELRVRDVVCWNALIGGYAQHGNGEEALSCYDQMKREGLSPNAVTFACIAKACGSVGAADNGKKIHAEVVREGLLGKNVLLGTAFVDMYAKCGALAKAQEVFNELPVRDVVCWNALITGYAQHGHGEEALNCFEQMQREGLSPDAVTLTCIVKACGSIGAVEKCKEVHAETLRKGFLEKNILLRNALVDTYAKCGLLGKAQELFIELPVRDVVSWTALITGYAQHGCGEEAVNWFERMQHEGISPDAATFAAVVKACGSTGAVEKGKELHEAIVRNGLLEKNVMLGTVLVDMYCKCGALAKAQQVFDELHARDVVTWTALIAGYAQHGHGQKALNWFERMQHEGLSPDAATFACILKACGSIGAAEKGREVHAEIVRDGLLTNNISLRTALVDMYAKCGELTKAQEVFDELPVWDVPCWNELIAGYAQHGHSEEALNCYERMRRDGLSPNAVTFVFSLKACGSIGAVEAGKKMHAEIVREGLLEKNSLLGTGLVDMYAKCGALTKAQQVFDELPAPDVACWNALIGGYALFGRGDTVFDTFNRMIGEGIEPDFITFTLVLNTCTHSGLVDEGQMYFWLMRSHFGINPTSEQHTCMVDLFGRAGSCDKALAVIKKMPSPDHLPAWFSLLSACRKLGNVSLGRMAFQHAIRLVEKTDAAFLCMSNIYTAAGMQEEAHKIDAMRVKNEACKKPG